MLGYRWTVNGVVALLTGDSSLATPGQDGAVSILGITIAINGWHTLFHIVEGVLALTAGALTLRCVVDGGSAGSV